MNEIEEEGKQEQEEHAYDDLLILMDWDDTLFPTSIMNGILASRDSNDLALVCDEFIELFSKLGKITLSLLGELIYKYGSDCIHIVTNSLDGWITESLSFASCINKIYSEIQTLLTQHNITMISAQSAYKKISQQNSPTLWKQLCFEDIFKCQKRKYSHMLSIGDQWTDHYAVKQCINSLYNHDNNEKNECVQPVHHVIKLKMNPDLNDMCNQILYIQTCFYQIFDIISYQKNPFTNNPQAITPVIIDYEHEENKYYQQQQKCLNLNVNLNVNVNVNVVTNQSPKQYMK